MRIHPLLVLSSAAVLATAFPASAQNITILTAPVGNVGNPEVPKGQAPDDCPGCGTVDYQFDIGVHEVTNAQYAAFLNAVAATDTYSLYDPAMAGGQGGIVRSGTSGSYVYTTVSGRENWPVVFVTFWDAARFANWLENGQGNGSTETGTYLLNGVTNPKSPVSRGLGSWVIPSRNEWVKAAYYSGSGSVYSGYPTQSDSIKPGMANYFSGDGGTVSLVPVGSYAYPSHYGTYDQGGNANEWTDTSEGSGDPMQYALGGSFEVPAEQLAIDQQSGDQFSNTGLASTGFRVAKVIPPLPPIAILTTPVGDPCNPGWEQDNGAGFPELCGGGVPYLYAIGVYEVTNAQYAAFLNAVAATDTYSLYNPAMAGSLGGIVRLGDSGGYSYWPVSGRESWPVNYVSFWDAARFVNWLENGQGSGGTETGTYTLNGVTNPTNQPTRNAGSTWAVASTNEWIKAAYGQGYFDGTGEGCCGATTEKCSDYGYVRYATQTPDLEPSACNIAASAIDAPRPVGSYPYASHYGTYDQDGNVSEITETWDDLLGPDQMTAIGGGYDTDDVEIGLCDNTFESFPTSESADLGFRIVEITGTGGCNDADFDNNGIVDAADLGSLISAWGPCGTTSCVADINRDGQVDGVDIGHMLGFWGLCPN